MTEEVLKNLVTTLSSLPGIGRKSAMRISFHILRMDSSSFESLVSALRSVKENIRFCQICGGMTESIVCEICQSSSRSSKLICVVEQAEDIFFIEKTGEIRGKYHVLNGVISPLDGIGPEKLRIRELLVRLQEGDVEEILMATNPTLEGDATASYISSLLKESHIKITRIAHGMTVGSTLEFADQYTLSKAIKSRTLL